MSSDASALFTFLSLVVSLTIAVVSVVSMWRIFTKARRPGWAAIIPIYNAVVLLQIIGRPIWFIIFAFFPLVNLILAVVICLDLARSFGKSALFGVGILFLSIIFLPVLAFSDARYVGPASKPAPAMPAQA